MLVQRLCESRLLCYLLESMRKTVSYTYLDLQSSPISLSGCTTPISLFTAIIETKQVFGVIAASNSFRLTNPLGCTGKYVTVKPSCSNALQESNTHLCSYDNNQQRASFMYTYRNSGNDMIFLVFVEPSCSFYAHIVSLSSTRGKNNFFRICSN